MKEKIFLLLILFLFLFACTSKYYIKKDGKTIASVELADTPYERTIGLSGRYFLQKNHGMLFVFEEPGYYSFWMKNTRIPLEIIFLDENMTVVSIQQMPICDFEPCVRYGPPSPILYALEVNQGFSAKNNISIGTKLELVNY